MSVPPELVGRRMRRSYETRKTLYSPELQREPPAVGPQWDDCFEAGSHVVQADLSLSLPQRI